MHYASPDCIFLQLIELKKGCDFTSSIPLIPDPIRTKVEAKVILNFVHYARLRIIPACSNRTVQGKVHYK